MYIWLHRKLTKFSKISVTAFCWMVQIHRVYGHKKWLRSQWSLRKPKVMGQENGDTG